LHGQYGQSGYNDDAAYTGGLTFGTSLADNRGHFMLNISHDKEQGLRSASRAATNTDISASPAGITNPQFSTYNPQGNFFFNSSASGFQNSPTTPAGEFSFTPSGALINQDLGPGYNRSQDRLIAVPIERTLLASTLAYDLTDHHHLYSELTYADSTTHSLIEPTPLAANGTPAVYGAALDANGDPIGMPVSNAYLQTLPALAPIVSEINAWNSTGANCVGSLATNPAYDCINYLTFRRRLTDIGDRGNDAVRQTYRAVLGVNGDLPFGDWKYDASYVYGRTTDQQVTHGGVNTLNFEQALNSVVDPVSGKIVCADPVAVKAGCVPINIFGQNSITPAAAAYVGSLATRNVVMSEEVTNAYATGSIATLPAGKVSLVVGTEFRKDSSSEIQDPLTNEGLNASNAIPNVYGTISVKEAFAELEVPLLKDLAFAKSLGLDGAYRQAHYDTSGSVNSSKIGLNWAITPDIRLRGVYSSAVRAPNVGELFGGQGQTFPTGLNDPCDGTTASSSGQVAVACRAIPAVAAAIAAHGAFTYTPLDYQTIFGLIGSNPDLKVEKSKTKTYGFVLTPSFVPNFSMSVDYFDINVEGAVSAIPFQTSINDCLATGTDTFCNNVIRNAATGKITELLQLALNVGHIRSTGIDTVIRYRWDMASFGRMDLNLTETHQMKLEQAVPGAPTEVDLGQLNSGGRLGAGFKDRASLIADYGIGAFDFSWKLDFEGPIQDTTPANGNVYEPLNHVPAYYYSGIQGRYTFDFADRSKLTAYLGANNVFNKKPPFLPMGMASDVTGTNTAADSYDVIGVFWYGGFRVKF
jgi:outer membrane receptor protein involved in Fe transport